MFAQRSQKLPKDVGRALFMRPRENILSVRPAKNGK